MVLCAVRKLFFQPSEEIRIKSEHPRYEFRIECPGLICANRCVQNAVLYEFYEEQIAVIRDEFDPLDFRVAGPM